MRLHTVPVCSAANSFHLQVANGSDALFACSGHILSMLECHTRRGILFVKTVAVKLAVIKSQQTDTELCVGLCFTMLEMVLVHINDCIYRCQIF